ncbi:hypothetical protein BOW53_14050 [Solemya pervernicosa gill symbiont]|uniref:Uncharacterized protein n=2 Tax=Gammaproteobacteria incertae sedis TaxID=118884 RepID=A0A1T2L142_9GAMM|nr:hypothetical protein [Candidatus Reidiella endopervernicosa]OOZ38825.1 hypothetical protein BOW53_14050 [Solemya pervernicosa gill symbiont]QKQ27429.1 hypothetical protein HUE57_14910 [Candidatus Reidiella endopervernicosa]
MSTPEEADKNFRDEHLAEHFAVIYAPRRKRDRYPENTVELFPSESTAMDSADANQKRYPACVRGPFRSSEGLRLFYLIRWLD